MQTERQLQECVKHWLIDELHYEFLGSLENLNNSPVIEELLRKNLALRHYPPEAISRAVYDLDTLTKSQGSLYQVNEKIYNLLRYGLHMKDEKGRPVSVNYIDWQNVSNNDFYIAEEVSVLCRNGINKKRPDLVLYVNGIALGMIELKNSRVSVGKGIRQLITNQKNEYIQNFFSTQQILMAGNGSEGLRYGVIETPEKYFLTWQEDTHADDTLSKKIRELQAQENDRLRNEIISLCQHERFLSLIHDFMIFDAGRKKIARHNQYFAVIASQARILQGEGGIIWNTQGSGKSLIMVWLTKWIREHIDDSRVVIITDREELDTQIEGVFQKAGEKNIRRARDCADLRNILNNNVDAVICSLIHKYGHNAGKQSDIDFYTQKLLENLPQNYEAKGNIIAFIDECHRTNSGKLHEAVKILMPRAKLIGFTGTPLLKSDKPTSLATFGPYIHTYKFNEAVKDGVIVDLRYEARDVGQFLSDKNKIDTLFDAKTHGLTEHARKILKRRWATISKLYSSRERLERIAADIIFDMNCKPRLVNDRGNAMLVAGSVYEACRYWEIFQTKGFTKCAVVTSYEPTSKSVRTATSDLEQESEDEYKKRIYDRMLDGKTTADYERKAKQIFKESPAQMKLLIVVDKLLTGFDAIHATYLYIDKSMRDHDLFQAICRVNRPDGDDKDYGYIVDYMDLFKNIESAIKDYTSEAFNLYDKKDVEGVLKSCADEAKAEMSGSLVALKDLLSGVENPQRDSSYIEFFNGCEKVQERENLYKLTASITRAFSNCCNRLTTDYDYTPAQVQELREKIWEYNRLKDMIKIASCDYIDMRAYEADMRYILDTYIHAADSKIVNAMSNMSLLELLVDNKNLSINEVLRELNCDETAKAEVIENNIKHEIILKQPTNEAYYNKLSEMLNDLIKRRKNEALDYSEYLKQVIEIAGKVLHPEKDINYPESIRNNSARRAIYDYMNHNEALTLDIDNAIAASIRPGFKESMQKSRDICRKIRDVLAAYGIENENEITLRIFEIAKLQPEYDQ